MTDLTVRYEGGDRLSVLIRGHQLTVDQPLSEGGEDTAPTPTELFVAGLASCIGFYAERYLRRHELPTDGLEVECSFAFASDRPARVGEIQIRVLLPQGFPEERRKALLAVLDRCTVHSSLLQTPEVDISLEETQRVR